MVLLFSTAICEIVLVARALRAMHAPEQHVTKSIPIRFDPNSLVLKDTHPAFTNLCDVGSRIALPRNRSNVLDAIEVRHRIVDYQVVDQ